MTPTDLAFSAVADHVIEFVQLMGALQSAINRRDSVSVSALSTQIDVKLEDIKSYKNTAIKAAQSGVGEGNAI